LKSEFFNSLFTFDVSRSHRETNSPSASCPYFID
jgi:hypothetical protein